jgi:hypothetical protein
MPVSRATQIGPVLNKLPLCSMSANEKEKLQW